MAAIISGTDFRLYVSRKVSDWVDRSERSHQDAFHAALAFAREALPRALAQLGSVEAFVVVHFNSVMIVGLAPELNSFCVFAFHVDDHDPCPPDGPGSAVGNGLLATEFADRLGLGFAESDSINTLNVKSLRSVLKNRFEIADLLKTGTICRINSSKKLTNILPTASIEVSKKIAIMPKASTANELARLNIQDQTDFCSNTDNARAVDDAWAGLAAFHVREKLSALPMGAQSRNS